jgi:hypothetical protein
MDTVSLPTTGVYTVVVDRQAGTGSNAHVVPCRRCVRHHCGRQLRRDGDDDRPRPERHLTFSGTSGQRISLLGTNSTFAN